MAEKKEKIEITDDIHKKLAIDAFNKTWSLIDKKDKTQEEIDEMIHMAHASRYHWGKIGQPIHFERGEWQISRVYSLIGQPEAALYHPRTFPEGRGISHRYVPPGEGRSCSGQVTPRTS